MTAVLAAVRADETHFPLFVHVLGAMILVGGLVAAAAFLVFARGDVPSLRRGYWTLLAVALPGWFVMRIGAEWIYSKEYSGDNDPSWVGIGYAIAEPSGLLILIATILTYLGARRLRSGGGGGGMAKVATVLATIAVAFFVVAIWAMTTKPS
jgi:hypothetical protein